VLIRPGFHFDVLAFRLRLVLRQGWLEKPGGRPRAEVRLADCDLDGRIDLVDWIVVKQRDGRLEHLQFVSSVPYGHVFFVQL
jgi:hypothetical protein